MMVKSNDCKHDYKTTCTKCIEWGSTSVMPKRDLELTLNGNLKPLKGV